MTNSPETIAAAREIYPDEPLPFWTREDELERIASIIQKHYAAKDAEIEELKQQSSINCLEWQDWERWATEVLTDFIIPFDNHKAGMRFALVDFIYNLRQERDQLKARDAELEKALCFFQSVIKSGEPWTEHCENAFKAAMEKQK